MKHKNIYIIVGLILTVGVTSAAFMIKQANDPFSPQAEAQANLFPIHKSANETDANVSGALIQEPAAAAGFAAASLSTPQQKPISCDFTMPEKPQYAGQFLSIKKKAIVAPGEAFQIQVFMENTGNVPWFSDNSGCSNVHPTYLGTENERDRLSPFAADLNFWDSHWVSGNRIKMDNKKVEPGETASFTFWSKAPQTVGYYREYFAPVIEGVTWLEDEAQFSFDVRVGEFELTENQQAYIPYLEQSGNLAALDLEGEKKVEVSLKQQVMWIKVGDTAIRTFPVSTGKYSTPTPKGKYKILLKQEVRVGGKSPHYVMPKFMMFQKSGYGIHALPSLRNDRGQFWQEALNHIGSPKSHGCIRLLPEDANFAFNFLDVGTTVEVRV